MKSVKGKVAAVTGAGSGIGRATAVRLAREGCHVALSDVNEQGLEETAALCRAHGVTVRTTRVDVSRRQEVHAWADATARDFGAVHVVVNNAGVALGSTIEDMSYEDLEWLMGVNFWGVVHGTKAFLPHLKAAGEGHVVNISSVFGIIGVATQGAYNAAKFAVRGFTEALRQELEVEGSGVSATSVHPGGVKTNIARAARMTAREGWVDKASGSDFEKAFRTTPERAAEDILDAILHNRRRKLVGKDAVAIDLLQRALPTLYQRLLVSGLRRRRAKLLAKAPAAPAAVPAGPAPGSGPAQG
jgi:NAD(P)-dependent dehydrogenase (short-subunit alcohol dehydrogenase family)